MTEVPRADIGFIPEDALARCQNPHCVAMIKAVIGEQRDVAACQAERQISDADDPQTEFDKYPSLRRLIHNCAFREPLIRVKGIVTTST